MPNTTNDAWTSGSASSARKDESLDEEMGISVQDLLRLLPCMSKEDKKVLYKHLRKDQEEEILKVYGPMVFNRCPSKLKRPDQSSKEDVAEPPGPNKMPAPAWKKKKKKLEGFRIQLYEAAKDRKGRAIPSQASDFRACQPETCRHDYDRLLWGANGHAHWANC